MGLIRHVPLLDMGLKDTIVGGATGVDILDADNYSEAQTDGPFGKALKMHSMKISYPDVSSTPHSEFSIAFWFRPYEYGNTANFTNSWPQIFHIRSKGPLNNAETLRLAYDRGNNYRLFGNNVFSDSAGFDNLDITSALAPIGQWTHIIYTVKSSATGTNVKLYINGQYAKEQTTTYVNGTITSENVVIGQNGKSLDVGVCDFRVYDHMLSNFEIAELQKKLLIHYPFDVVGGGQ